MSGSRAPYVLVVGAQQVEPDVTRGAEALERLGGEGVQPRAVTRFVSEIELSWWDRLRVLWHGRLAHHVQFMAEAEARITVPNEYVEAIPFNVAVTRVAITQSWVSVARLPCEAILREDEVAEVYAAQVHEAARDARKENVDG